MKIYTTLPATLPKTALTIGFFDGMHLGHQALLRRLKQNGTHTAVLTFVHHPLKILKPGAPHPPLLTPWPLKLALMEQMGIDSAILLPFSQEFGETSFEELLSRFDLSHLILGVGSAFGKNREGSEQNIKTFAEKKKFEAHYIPKSTWNGETVSSSAVRKAIGAKNLRLAAQLLGRPHAFYFPANETELDGNGICLPPNGTYTVKAANAKIDLEIRASRVFLPQPLPSQTLLSFDPESTHV